MGSWWMSWPPSWHPFLWGEVMMSLYGEDRCSLWATCSLGHGSVAPTSEGRVGGIGFGQSGRTNSRLWFSCNSECDRVPVHPAGRDLGSARPREVT
jgi:hypothetical protein